MPLHNPKAPVWSVAGKKKDVVLQIADVVGLVDALAAAGGAPTVQAGGVAVGTRPKLNFVEGANVTLTLVDDAANDRVNITVDATGGGGVSSVGLTVPSFLSVSGSPVTSTGTIAVSAVNQNANLIFAGPGTGSAAAPTFRAVVAADIAAALETAFTTAGLTVDNVSVSGVSSFKVMNDLDGVVFKVENDQVMYYGEVRSWNGAIYLAEFEVGSPWFTAVTASGDPYYQWLSDVANWKFQMDQSGGTQALTLFSDTYGTAMTVLSSLAVSFAGAVTAASFAGVGSSITLLNGSNISSGTVAVARLPLMAASGGSHAAGIVPDPGPASGTTKFLREDATWAVPAGTGGGTVTSVAVTVPSFLSVSGSPVTTSGTIAVSAVNQNANAFFSGPATGGAASPAFRAIVAADLPAADGSNQGAMSAAHFTLVNGATDTDAASTIVKRDSAKQIFAAAIRAPLYTNVQGAHLVIQPGTNATAGGSSVRIKGGTGNTTGSGNVELQDGSANVIVAVGMTGSLFSKVPSLSFFSNSLVAQQVQGTDLKDMLVAYGLYGGYADATPLDLDGGVITADGSGLTALNASNLSSGTVADARLSSNVPRKNAANTFANANTFTPDGTGSIPVVVKGLSGQTAKLQEWRTYADSVMGSLSDDGLFEVRGAVLQDFSGSTVKLKVKGSGQSVPLQTWGPGDTVNASMGEDGVLVCTDITDNISNQQVQVYGDSTPYGTRRGINFISGSNVSLSLYDNSYYDRVDVTINASGGGGEAYFGTVTNVDLSMPTPFTVSGGSISSSGTFTVSWGAGFVPAANLGGGTADSLTYLRGDQSWTTFPSIPSSIDDLSDVAITSAATGHVLYYNGSGWVNATPATAGISATGHAHANADGTNPGFMTSAHYALVNGAASANTASTIVKRGSSGEVSTGDVTVTGVVVASKRITGGVVSATSTSYTTDAANGNQFNISYGSNLTLNAVSNGVDGQRVTWRLKATAGSLTVTLTAGVAGGFRFGTDIASITASGTSGKTDYLTAVYNAADDRWDVVGFVRGF